VAAEEEPGRVRVAAGGSAEEADIVREADRVRYRPRTGDPLAVGGERALTDGDWLAATWDSAYPDACIQLLDQFRAPRTGDLIVAGHEGFDFRRRFEMPEHKAGHGSLIRAHMQVPVWTSVPGPTGPVRTVDLFPAMLQWLGQRIPDCIDGRSAWSSSRAPALAMR
jgi:hypothetical protein